MKRRISLRPLLRHLPSLIGITALALLMYWKSVGFGSRVMPGEAGIERSKAGDRPTATVERMKTPEIVSAVGTVEPRFKAEIGSRLLAAVMEVNVHPGDAIEPGQVLVVLDDREIQAQLREAEAGVSAIEADLAVRKQEFARYRAMFAEKAVTKEAFDRVEGAYRVALAQLERARQQVARARVMLTYTTITAPSAGILADRFVDPGDLAVPGKPLLIVHDPTKLELHANVREALATHLRPGEKLDVRVDSAHFRTTGVVREIVPRADVTSRSVLVKVRLPNAPTNLYIGSFGRLQIPVGTIERTVVPKQAVVMLGQLDIVHVVNDAGEVDRRFVRVGDSIDSSYEILSGLEVGERVILHDTQPAH